MSNYQRLPTNHTNLAQNLINTRNLGKIRVTNVKVRGVGVVRCYHLNYTFSLISLLVSDTIIIWKGLPMRKSPISSEFPLKPLKPGFWEGNKTETTGWKAEFLR
jgi:hypothetical protein